MNINYREDLQIIVKIFKPIMYIAVGYFLLNFSHESLIEFISSQGTNSIKVSNLPDLYPIFVMGSTGLALFIYSLITVMFKLTEIIIVLIYFVAKASNSAIASMFKRFVTKSKAKDE